MITFKQPIENSPQPLLTPCVPGRGQKPSIGHSSNFTSEPCNCFVYRYWYSDLDHVMWGHTCSLSFQQQLMWGHTCSLFFQQQQRTACGPRWGQEWTGALSVQHQLNVHCDPHLPNMCHTFQRVKASLSPFTNRQQSSFAFWSLFFPLLPKSVAEISVGRKQESSLSYRDHFSIRWNSTLNSWCSLRLDVNNIEFLL